jgi:hypothetical protein
VPDRYDVVGGDSWRPATRREPRGSSPFSSAADLPDELVAADVSRNLGKGSHIFGASV